MSRVGQLALAAVLILWQPLTFASTAGHALPSLGMRGWMGSIELIAAGLVAAVSVAAAWSLWNGAPQAVPLARAAVVLATARALQSLYWTVLPSDVVPGTETILASAIIVHGCLWLAYLSRVRRADAVS
jgi:hypothetical protein